MRDKYVIGLLIASAAIVVPAGIAHLAGVPAGILATVAVIQLFASLVFFVTSLISLGFCVNALVHKEWKKAALRGAAILLPVAVWCLLPITNRPGWDAVMGI